MAETPVSTAFQHALDKVALMAEIAGEALAGVELNPDVNPERP